MLSNLTSHLKLQDIPKISWNFMLGWMVGDHQNSRNISSHGRNLKELGWKTWVQTGSMAACMFNFFGSLKVQGWSPDHWNWCLKVCISPSDSSEMGVFHSKKTCFLKLSISVSCNFFENILYGGILFRNSADVSQMEKQRQTIQKLLSLLS